MSEGTGRKLCLYTPMSRGAAWFVAALVEGMAKAGAQVEFIAPEVEPADREPVHPNILRRELARGGGGQGHRLIRGIKSAARIGATFPMLARARFRSREIVVTFYDWLPVQIAQFVWIKALGGRLTHIVHDATPHAWRFPRSLIWMEKRMQYWSYSLPDRIVVLTEAARDDLARNWGRSHAVHVIPHGAYDAGEPPPLPESDDLLLFGMLRRNKNIAPAVEAVCSLPTAYLKVAGARHVEDWGYWDECEAIRAGAEDRIGAEIGFVDEQRLHEILAESAAVLLPYEDFASASGVAILAAFAGRILIATDVGGIGELMDHGLQAVCIERPVTAASIAAAITRFSAIPHEQRVAMAAESRAALLDYLSWDRIGHEYMKVLMR